MSNKKLGTAFEKEMIELFSSRGFWVHFISPDNRGAQPFDIIAAKNGFVIVGDCKTSSSRKFNFSRLEDNQIMAFDKWLACGNNSAYVFVKYNNEVYFFPYEMLKKRRVIDLDNMPEFKNGWWIK